MDFTREPIIESVITPKEGCKLVVRSSKSAGQEEFFVDAVEMVSFGGTFFLRSLEKPKAFLVPATDYEILEVRETRMVLKNVGLDRSIKIGSGRGDGPKRQHKESTKTQPELEEKVETKTEVKEISEQKEKSEVKEKAEPKKRERRRHYRKRRSGSALEESPSLEKTEEEPVPKRIKIPVPETFVNLEKEGIGKPVSSYTTVLNSLLPPPPTLISESIERYKDNELFKNVFIPKTEKEDKIKKSEEVENLFVDEQALGLEITFSENRYSEDDIFNIPTEEDSKNETEELPKEEERLPKESFENTSEEIQEESSVASEAASVDSDKSNNEIS